MDIYTKLFLANWVVLLTVALMDRNILNDALSNHGIVHQTLGLWALIIFISVPVWIIYLIFK